MLARRFGGSTRLLVLGACWLGACSLLAPSRDELSGGVDGTPTGGTAGSQGSGGASGGSSGGNVSAGGSGLSSAGGSSSDAGMDGSAGLGGSGDGGGPPVVVLDCSNLGAVGEWEDVTPPEVDLSCFDPPDNCNNVGTNQVVLDPRSDGTLYIATDRQGIYKSTDCGGTWTLVSTGKNSVAVSANSGSYFEMDPSDSEVLYLGGQLRSSNSGVDWERIWPPTEALAGAPPYPGGLKIDPENSAHLLFNFVYACEGDFAPSCIAESTDTGASWKLLKMPGNGYGFPFFIDSSRWLWAQDVALYLTTDSGGNWTTLADTGVWGVGGRIYHGTSGYYLGANGGVLFSPDGNSWSQLPNSGDQNRAGVVGSGTTLYSSPGSYCHEVEYATYLSAPEDDGKPWTALPQASMTHAVSALGYDRSHHILYSANCLGGFWRMITE